MRAMPLKILYATREKYPTTRVDLTDLFSRNLIASGFMQVDWVMQAFEAQSFHCVELGAGERVFVGPSSSVGGKMGKIRNHLSGLLHDLRIWQLSGQQKYDIIQVRDKFFAAVIALLAARYRGCRFVYWCSFPYAEADLNRVETIGESLSVAYRTYYRVRGALSKWLLYSIILPRTDHVFVQSDRMLEDMSREGVPVEMMTPVPMGVALDRIDPNNIAERVFPELAGKMPVIYMGTMVRLRGLDFLIEAFEPVAHVFPDAVLLMVGGAGDTDMRFLRDTAEKRGLAERVVFTGQIPMKEAWQYVRASRVCLSPFKPSPILDSTSPTKVVEYLALERPVVANDHPDQAKVIHESGGGVITPYEPEAFGNGIIQILSDQERAVAMGVSGCQYIARNRSYSVIADAVSEVYTAIAGNGPAYLKLKGAD